MTLTPAYAYEHHLVFLLLPLAAVGTGLSTGRLPRWSALLLILLYVGLAIPAPELRRLWRQLPHLAPALRQVKLLAGIGLYAACCALVWRSPEAREEPPQASGLDLS